MARTAMPRSTEELEAFVAQQQEEFDRRQEMMEERDALIAIFREWKRLLVSQRFGARSERFASDAQARLFDEAEAIVDRTSSPRAIRRGRLRYAPVGAEAVQLNRRPV